MPVERIIKSSFGQLKLKIIVFQYILRLSFPKIIKIKNINKNLTQGILRCQHL